tara:strand:+ start:1063 stop:2283 length:1221 start_codon:yes stop_codon:yes gene_type:complete
MINAGLDPLGRTSLTAPELAATFNILRADCLLDDLEAFDSYDTLVENDRSIFFNQDDMPEAVIFISHRWEDTHNPDPTVRKFNALRRFLEMIAEVADWRKRWFGSKATTTVLRHGAYQAAYFLAENNRFDPDAASAAQFGHSGSETLRRIGIWYDFSCLSQLPETLAARKETLSRLHDLLGASNLLSFREPGDDYDYRGWCAAELSIDPDIQRSRVRKIYLRLDKLDTPLEAADLLKLDSPMADMPDMLLSQLGRAKTGIDLALAVGFFQGLVGVDAEDDRETPLLFNRRGPYIFAVQEKFMTTMIHALEEISDKARLTADLVEIVVAAARSAGLRTTEEEDLAFTSLMILYARHRGAPDTARLYGECLERRLEGRSTRLAEFSLLYDEQDDWKIHRGGCTFTFEN